VFTGAGVTPGEPPPPTAVEVVGEGTPAEGDAGTFVGELPEADIEALAEPPGTAQAGAGGGDEPLPAGTDLVIAKESTGAVMVGVLAVVAAEPSPASEPAQATPMHPSNTRRYWARLCMLLRTLTPSTQATAGVK
jgi:hypothetical protein